MRGNNDGGSTDRFASFGVLFATSQFFAHTLERIGVACVDSAVGLLAGSGANGEQTRISRLYGNQLRRGYYSNAPQAFAQEFDGWNFVLDANGVYAEFSRMVAPGVGVNFTNCHATFDQSGTLDGTLVKIRRGTGIVQFAGGRMEHLSCLFDYDAVDNNGSNCNLDLIVRGMEFTVFKGASLPFVNGWDLEGATLGTNYGLFVEDCKFGGKDGADPEDTDLVFTTYPVDDIRCVFEKCRFVGLRSFSMQNFNADFVRCFKNDFEKSGGTPFVGPLRQFTQEAGAPRNRTQSVRTVVQDTPWIQTGPRINILKNSDFVGQEYSADATDGAQFNDSGPWVLTSGTDLLGFGKWGAFAEANISPSPEAFFVALDDGQALTNNLGIDLSAPWPGDPASKVVTYQCLCRVKGKARFALVKSSDTAVVYDEIIIDSPGDFSDATLVTLRLQVKTNSNVSYLPKVVLENLADSGGTAWQVFWQQAWGGSDAPGATYPLFAGLANAGQVRTPGGVEVVNTYNWAVNALGIKAASRFQLPLLDTRPPDPEEEEDQGGEAKFMGWQSGVPATEYDLVDGELYYDQWQEAALARMSGGWFVVQQPDRVAVNPSSPLPWVPSTEKNIVFSADGTKVVDLETSTAAIAPGTIVRVFNFQDTDGGNSVTVKFDGASDHAVNRNCMCEFLFYDDSGPRWLVTQDNVAAALKP